MSLFKIIKAGRPTDTVLVKFAFEALPELSELPFKPDTPGFQPLFAAGASPAGGNAEAGGTTDALVAEEMTEGSAGPSAVELQQLLKESFEKGFADGQQQAEERFSSSFRSLTVAVEEVSGLKGRIVRESEEDLLQLAMMVSKQIIQQELSQNREILACFVAEAVRGIVDQDDIVICFNPEDCRIVSEKRHLYLAGIGDKRQITIRPDDSVPVGGCVIDAPTGLVDARVDAQLAEMYKLLIQERAGTSDAAQNLPMIPEPLVPGPYGVEKYGYPKD